MDKILNLSAFGEDIKPNQNQPTFVPNNTEKTEPNHGKVLSMILQNISQTKLLHWQSLKYGQHKALDELFEGLIDLGDTLAESMMGKYGRPVLNESDLCLNLRNFEDPENKDLTEFTTAIYLFYSGECKEMFSKDPELLNIIEEILGLIDKIKYLLTLK